MAEAEAQAVRRIALSLPDGDSAMYLLGLKYLDALPQIAQGKGSTVFLPTEAIGVMGALGGLREMLRAAGPAAAPAPTESDGVQRPPAGAPPGALRSLLDPTARGSTGPTGDR
jgi:hypothetical protein